MSPNLVSFPPSFPPAGRLPRQTQRLRFPPPYTAMAENPDSMARAAVLFEDGWTLTVWHTVEVYSRQSDLTSTCGLPCYVRVNFRFEGETWPQWDACFGTVALNDVPDSPERGCAETSISWVSLTGDAVDRGTYTRGKPPGTFKENLPWAIIESFKMTGLFQVQTRSGEACWQSSEKMELSPLLNVRWLSLLPSFIPSPFCVLHLFIYYPLQKSQCNLIFS